MAVDETAAPMSAIVLADADAIASQIGSGSWAGGAPSLHGGAELRSTGPGLPDILAPFARPLDELLELYTGDPASAYHASVAWEHATGSVASARDQLTSACRSITADLSGLAAHAIVESLSTIAGYANVIQGWTKVVSQALQLCSTIFEAVRSLVCEALSLLAEFAQTIVAVLVGSPPWDFGAKARAVVDFAESVERFVGACVEAASAALKAARELVRLITDLYRAINPFYREFERLIGGIIDLIPGGTPPDVPGSGQTTGPNGAHYHPSKQPYPGSSLRIRGEYDYGYQHSYDLGHTDMTTEQLNGLFRSEFGRLFVPARAGDNSQLDMQLTGPGQRIQTSLFGTSIPNVTIGDISVQQVSDDGFVIAAEAGHPEYPGEVVFRLTTDNGVAKLQVTGAYNDSIVGRHDLGSAIDTNPANAAISDYVIWGDMQGRIADRLRYGE